MTKSNGEYRIFTSRDDHDRVHAADRRVGAEWPEFMLHDPVSDRFGDLFRLFPDFQLVLVDPANDETVAITNSIPFRWDGTIEDLPDDGWDWVMNKGFEDIEQGRTPNLLSAIQIVVFGTNRGRGISLPAVQAMKANGRQHGLDQMVAPVRPSRKCEYPLTPIDRYIRWTVDDGLPFDPWLRVHVRAGARIVKPCPTAMRIPGRVSEWEKWTGMRFPESGNYIVPRALEPVRIDIEHDRGQYIEPNVWMHHPAE